MKLKRDLGDIESHKTPSVRPSIRTDARAVRSSAALRQALLALLERKPFDQITVRDICAEASIHYATFFRHHTSKEALLDHIAADQINTVVELTLPIREAVGDATALKATCDYIEKHRALWDILLNGGAGAAMREEWLNKAKAVAAQRQPVAAWLPKELGTICSVSLIVETVAWWLRQPQGAHSATEMSQILHRLVTRSTLAAD